MKYVSPSVNVTAFNCPHCDVLTTQYWHYVLCTREKPDITPSITNNRHEATLAAVGMFSADDAGGEKSIGKDQTLFPPKLEAVENWRAQLNAKHMWLSQCHECKQVAIWIFNRMVWPLHGKAPLANKDMPDDVRLDYQEASSILDLSPRGSAALLRLAIQKLCKHLGEKGKNINDDIASLVKKGLPEQVQQALDIVRVIGNESVHPGTMDLKDDRETAERLFSLVNLIVEIRISQPKHVQEMYSQLPEAKLKDIAKRDRDSKS